MKRKTREECAADVEHTLDVLGKYWREHPFLRLGQIISNAWTLCDAFKRSPEPEIFDLFYVENAQLLEAIAQLEKQAGGSKFDK